MYLNKVDLFCEWIHQLRVNGSITVAFALSKMEDLAWPVPATITDLTAAHFCLYSSATGPGAVSS